MVFGKGEAVFFKGVALVAGPAPMDGHTAGVCGLHSGFFFFFFLKGMKLGIMEVGMGLGGDRGELG